MKILLFILFCSLSIIGQSTIQTQKETFKNTLSERANSPIASIEKPIASTGKKSEGGSEGLEKAKIASTEITAKLDSEVPRDNMSPVPSPTVEPDILETLCTKCAREAEASRLVLEAQTKYIATLELANKTSLAVVTQQTSLLNDYIAQVKDLKDDVAKADEQIKKKDTEITNLKHEVVIAQSHKCGIVCQATRVLTGVVIGFILTL